MEKVAGTAELERAGGAYDAADSIQSATSLLPDYNFADSEAAIGTSFSGIIGALVVVAITVGACYAFRFFRRKDKAKA
jgi:cobalt/nickel transport system permease protein